MTLATGNSSSLLQRRFSQAQAPSLSAAQLEMDALQAQLQTEAGNFSNLLAMAGGGLAYKVARSGFLSIGSHRALAVMGGLATEVSAFRAATNGFANLRGERPHENIFDAKAWFGTFMSFGVLKGAGRLAQGQSAFLAHGFQSSAMVAGNQLTYHMGLTHAPEGSLLQQLIHAEVTNMAMIGGNALLGSATGHSLAFLEKSFELRSSAFQKGARTFNALPAMHQNEILQSFKDSSLQAKLNPLFEKIRAGESGQQVAKALEAANITLEDVVVYTDFSNPEYAKNNYGRTLLHRDSHLEALVLGWRPGQHTRAHDHRAADGSPVNVVETAVQGNAGEIIYANEGARWREVERVVQKPGQVMSGGKDLYHLIFNAGDGNMISLHLYWPPLDLSRGTYQEFDPWARPISLSDRARNLEMPGPAQVSNWIRELQAKGVDDIINLGMGQNGFPPEVHIREAAANQALNKPATYGAVQGQPELITSIREKYQRDHGVRYSDQEVVVSNGGKSSLTLGCQALFQNGETAIILGPAWPSYREEVSLAGGNPVILLGEREAQYRITPAQLERTLDAHPNAKALILTNPSNPTGILYSRSELKAFGAIAEKRDLIVIADEIYDGHTYRGDFTAFASLPRMRSRTLTMNGGSKVYSLAGWRVTWLVGPEELIQAVVRLQAHEASNTDTMAQAALTAALQGEQGFIRRQVSEFEARAKRIVARLNEMELHTAMPEAAFYAFADARKYLNTVTPEGLHIRTDIELARYLLEKAHVAVVPGTYFFAPGNFRLAFGGAEIPTIERAMDRMEVALKALRQSELPPESPPTAAIGTAGAAESTATVATAFSRLRQQIAPYALPGLALASMWQGMSSGWALVAGLGVALTVGNPYGELTSKAVKPLLAASLIGLGAGMDLNAVARAGAHGVFYTLGGITITLGLGKLLSLVSGVERNQRRLIDCGTAICGGSAIAAITQTLGLKPKDPAVSVALGTVFTLNSLALFLFPMIGHKLNMSQHDFGLWSAMAIHDTSSVVGAAAAYGPEALETATTVKLARALWIIPLAFGMTAWDRRNQARSENPASRPAFPKFILGFLAAAAATTFIPELKPAGDFIAHRSQETMRLTLFLLGANMNFQSLRKVGPKPFLHGAGLWIAMGGLTLLGIEQGWID